jgi:hypothetical protein
VHGSRIGYLFSAHQACLLLSLLTDMPPPFSSTCHHLLLRHAITPVASTSAPVDSCHAVRPSPALSPTQPFQTSWPYSSPTTAHYPPVVRPCPASGAPALPHPPLLANPPPLSDLTPPRNPHILWSPDIGTSNSHLLHPHRWRPCHRLLPLPPTPPWL